MPREATVISGVSTVISGGSTVISGGPEVRSGGPTVIPGGPAVISGGPTVISGEPEVIPGGAQQRKERSVVVCFGLVFLSKKNISFVLVYIKIWILTNI